jgi:chromosome segregation ATPase
MQIIDNLLFEIKQLDEKIISANEQVQKEKLFLIDQNNSSNQANIVANENNQKESIATSQEQNEQLSGYIEHLHKLETKLESLKQTIKDKNQIIVKHMSQLSELVESNQQLSWKVAQYETIPSDFDVLLRCSDGTRNWCLLRFVIRLFHCYFYFVFSNALKHIIILK